MPQRLGEALLLTEDGFVADGPTVNIFAVKGERLATPALSASILPGITRDTVLQLIAEGRTNQETADALFISSSTVQACLKRVYQKLGVRSRTELAAKVGQSRAS